MVDLYVIVHEKQAVRLNSWDESPHAMKVRSHIDGIKRAHPYFLHPGDPEMVRKDLPEPSPNLRVLVAGAYREACVKLQKDALKEEGYNAEVCEEGSISFLGIDTKIGGTLLARLLKSYTRC